MTRKEQRERWYKIRDMYEEGYSIYDIAEDFGMCYMSIRTTLRRLGYKKICEYNYQNEYPRSGFGGRLFDRNEAIYNEYKNGGKTYAQIGREFDLTCERVSGIIKEGEKYYKERGSNLDVV